MEKLNHINFEEKINSGKPFLAKFSAIWCSPCKMLTPILEKVENIDIFEVDVEENQELASEYEISALPTLILFKEGQEKSRLVGLKTLEKIQEVVNEL